MKRNEKCENCEFAAEMPPDPNNIGKNNDQFQCHRYPPSVSLMPVQTAQGMGAAIHSVYPTVDKNNACGEWKEVKKIQH